jgi:hypothetical protein
MDDAGEANDDGRAEEWFELTFCAWVRAFVWWECDARRAERSDTGGGWTRSSSGLRAAGLDSGDGPADRDRDGPRSVAMGRKGGEEGQSEEAVVPLCGWRWSPAYEEASERDGVRVRLMGLAEPHDESERVLSGATERALTGRLTKNPRGSEAG